MNRLYLGWLILCGQEMRGQQWEPHTAVPTVRRGSHYESFGIIFALEVKGTEGRSHRWLSKQNSSLQARTGPEYKSHPISSSSMALLSNKSALRPSWLRHLSLHSYLTQRWETKAFLPRPPGWGESTIQIPPELTNKKTKQNMPKIHTRQRASPWTTDHLHISIHSAIFLHTRRRDAVDHVFSWHDQLSTPLQTARALPSSVLIHT